MNSNIICPNCGEIAKDNVKLFDESLKKQNIKISPVNPTCKLCGAEIVVSHTANGGNIIVLNGTCGSGKTTVAELLLNKNWLAIDGDCAIQSLRHKTGQKKYEWSELIDEITHEIDVLSMFGKNIVLSHVILPQDIDKYIEVFESRNFNYRFILLKPEYQTAVKRCETRTCHESITPKQWIKHFYDILIFDDKTQIVDNTNMTAEETAGYILKDNEIINHYDLLIDENNDPVRDKQILRDYMDKWDGQDFFNLLQLDKDKTVLEFAVGSGRLAIKTISHCEHFNGIDFSPKTIERANENLSQFKNKTLICADFLEYEFDTQFDVIYSSLTFLHIKEKQKAIEKIAALLKNSGRFVLSLSKDQSTELDYGTRKVPLYPDTPDQIKQFMQTVGLTVVNETETEFANIIVAEKE